MVYETTQFDFAVYLKFKHYFGSFQRLCKGRDTFTALLIQTGVSGFKSEDTGKCLHLQHEYSKSLS